MTQIRRLQSVNRVGGVIGRFGPNGERGVWPVHSLASDPYYDDVSLLLHMDGTDGSTTFTDSSKNAFTVTANGNAQIDDAQSKFGGASALFDGNGDYLTIPSNAAFDVGAGDFTIEFWLRLGQIKNFTPLFVRWNPTRLIFIAHASDNTVRFYMNTALVISGSATLLTGQWYHIAVARAAGSNRLFVDGTQRGSTVSNSFSASGTTGIEIGSNLDGNSGQWLNGRIDEVRMTKGRARYTSDFNPPTRAFLP